MMTKSTEKDQTIMIATEENMETHSVTIIQRGKDLDLDLIMVLIVTMILILNLEKIHAKEHSGEMTHKHQLTPIRVKVQN